MYKSNNPVQGVCVISGKSTTITKLNREDVSVIQDKISKYNIEPVEEKCSLHMCEAIWIVEGEKYQSFTALVDLDAWEAVEFYLLEEKDE